MMVRTRYYWERYTCDKEFKVNETSFGLDNITSDFSSNQMNLQNYSEQGAISRIVNSESKVYHCKLLLIIKHLRFFDQYCITALNQTRSSIKYQQ